MTPQCLLISIHKNLLSHETFYKTSGLSISFSAQTMSSFFQFVWHVTHATFFFWMKPRIYCLGKTQLFGTLRKIILFRHVIHTSRWTHLSLLQISMYTQSRHTGLKNLRLRGIPNDIFAGKMFAEQHQPSHNCIHISEETIIDELLRCCAASLSSSDRNTYFSSIFDTNFSGIILEIQKTGQG